MGGVGGHRLPFQALLFRGATLAGSNGTAWLLLSDTNFSEIVLAHMRHRNFNKILEKFSQP